MEESVTISMKTYNDFLNKIKELEDKKKSLYDKLQQLSEGKVYKVTYPNDIRGGIISIHLHVNSYPKRT